VLNGTHRPDRSFGLARPVAWGLKWSFDPEVEHRATFQLPNVPFTVGGRVGRPTNGRLEERLPLVATQATTW